MIKHPIDSAKNLFKIMYIVSVGTTNPYSEEAQIYIRMIEQICSKVCDKCHEFSNGDSVVKVRMSGNLVGEFLTFLVSTKGFDKATKMLKVVNDTNKFSDIIKSLESINISSKGIFLNPNQIRFSQSSVNGAKELIQNMKLNGWKGGAIDVVKMSDGKLTTIDNTRVVAAREAGINVKAIIHDKDEILPENLIKRFTTPKGIPQTWGEAVKLRILKQKASFRKNYPFGAEFMERIGD